MCCVRLLILLALCCLSKPSVAQNESLVVKEIATSQNYARETVNDIHQDGEGYIWVAQWSGLVRYDGYDVKLYQEGGDYGLKSNKITCIAEDSKQRLWIGTSHSGFYRYDYDQDKFLQYAHRERDVNSLSNNNVWAITEDQFGILWIGTEHGLNQFDPDTKTFTRYENLENDPRSLSHNFVYSIAQSPSGVLWVGTEDGLNRLVRDEQNVPDYFARLPLSEAPEDSDEYMGRNFVKSLAPVGPDRLLIGTRLGLRELWYDTASPSEFNVKTFTRYREDTGERTVERFFVNDIIASRPGYAWIATYGGLYRLDLTAGVFDRHFSQKPLNSGIVRSLYIDFSDVLWVGSEQGLNTIDLRAKPFDLHPFPKDNEAVIAMAEAVDRSGYWVGTEGAGMAFVPVEGGRVMVDKIERYQIKSSILGDLTSFVSDIIIDKRGYLWAATKGAGLFRMRESDISPVGGDITNFDQYSKHNQLADDYIMDLKLSAAGNIWLGYWDDGIGIYDVRLDTFLHFPHTSDLTTPLQEYPVIRLKEIQHNGLKRMYAGTRGGGIYVLEYDGLQRKLRSTEHFVHQESDTTTLNSNSVNALRYDRRGNLYVGTEAGLNRLDLTTGKNIRFATSKQKDSYSIESLIFDKDKNLWVTDRVSLHCIRRDNLRKAINQPYTSETFDKLLFNGIDPLTLSDGRLIFAGTGGMLTFAPAEVRPDTVIPLVWIDEFKLSNETVPVGKMKDGRTLLKLDISHTKQIELCHSDNVITLGFVGLQFTEPFANQYAHRLLGFNDHWMFTNADQRSANYTNLPAGDYVFEVKAANPDGVWSQPTRLEIHITPPWWLTWWALVLYGLLFFIILYAVRKFTELKARYAYDLQLEKIERDKLQEVNQLKLRFFTNISHELRTPLTLILSPLEEFLREEITSKKRRKEFARMHHSASRLLVMINQLLDIRKGESGLMRLKVVESDIVKFVKEITLSFLPLARQADISLEFVSSQSRLPLWFDRLELEKVFSNLIGNALKFTESDGRIQVSVRELNDDFVRIAIKDNGVGLTEEQAARVFDRFYQAEQSNVTSHSAGTGIGLTLSRNIVSMHQGKLVLESKPGAGTTFFVDLQRGYTHFSPDERVEDYVGSENGKHYPKLPVKTTNQRAEARNPVSTPKHPYRLLVVEDNVDIREYIVENLAADYTITEAANGKEGHDLALADPPDLVIADIAMPEMDGLTLCELLKSNLSTSHIPIILLTARTSLVFQINGYDRGADDYITKPFNIQLLRRRVANLLAARERFRKLFKQPFDFSPSEIAVGSLDEGLLQNLKEVVEKQIDNSNFSVEELARELHMSRMQLYRKLKGLTGKTPNQLIRSVRMKRAAQLLQHQQFNVSDVTYMVGYNDLKSFRKQFKKEFGVSPSAYADSNAIDPEVKM